MIVQTVKFFKLVFVLNSVRLSLSSTLNLVHFQGKWSSQKQYKEIGLFQWLETNENTCTRLSLYWNYMYCESIAEKNQRRASIWLVRVCREQVIRGQSTINNRFGRIYRSSLYILQNRIIILDPWHELKKEYVSPNKCSIYHRSMVSADMTFDSRGC